MELEVGGQLAPGLQATGGYTIMRVRGDDDRAVRTFVPRNIARLNISYASPAFDRAKIGASFQYQSRIYLEPVGVVSSTTGQQVRITQGGYALLDLFARYALTDNLAVSANLRNVTNSKYLGALNYDQGFYGAPRTVLGTVSLRY